MLSYFIKRDFNKMNWWKFYFSTKGRVARYQYNLYLVIPFILLNILVHEIQSLLAGSIRGLVIGAILGIVISVITFWPFIVVTNKRLHDRGSSGWKQLAYALPFIFGLVLAYIGSSFDTQMLELRILLPIQYYTGLLICGASIFGFLYNLMALPGVEGKNHYGASPIKEQHDAENKIRNERLKKAKENE
mgnify:CR=1 FL=1